VSYTHSSGEDDRVIAELTVDGQSRTIEGEGNGPIAAFVDAFMRGFGVEIQLREYHEHALSAAADATAAAYIEAEIDDEPVWGVGLHPSIVGASLRAVTNAVDRAIAQGQLLAHVTQVDAKP
jgi:2-isopropylmalate synthase